MSMKRIAGVALVALTLSVSACIVVPVRPVQPPPHVVYVQPPPVAPGPGWGWAYHPQRSWGWYHEHEGWRHD